MFAGVYPVLTGVDPMLTGDYPMLTSVCPLLAGGGLHIVDYQLRAHA